MSYLTEAFKALDALNEDTFSVSDDGIKKLAEFEDNDDLVDEITVYDADAEDTEDLEDSYVGKVIVDCNVCHSKIYKDKSDVVIDEETQNANITEECPYCYSTDGFKVIGEVAPMTTETEEKVEVEDDIEESLNEAVEPGKYVIRSFARVANPYTAQYSRQSGKHIGYLGHGGRSWVSYDDKGIMTFDTYDDAAAVMEDQVKDFYNAEVFKVEGPLELEESCKSKMNEDKTYIDAQGGFGEPGEKITFTEIKKYWDDNFDSDPSLKKYDSFEDWFAETKKNYLKETDESLNEAVDLLTRENTIASVLSKHMDELSEYTDANSMRNAIIDILDKSEIADKDAVKKLKRVLFSKKSTGALLSTIATYMTGEKVAKVGRRNVTRRAVNENIGQDIDEYQQWVDYDMKRYGKISDQTNKEIKEAGLQVVKDKYGDYQVIAGKYDESLVETRKRRIKESFEFDYSQKVTEPFNWNSDDQEVMIDALSDEGFYADSDSRGEGEGTVYYYDSGTEEEVYSQDLEDEYAEMEALWDKAIKQGKTFKELKKDVADYYYDILSSIRESLNESENSDITELEDGVYQYRPLWLPGVGDKKEVRILLNERDSDVEDTDEPVYDIEVMIEDYSLDETEVAKAIGCRSNPYLTSFEYDSALYWCEKIRDYLKSLDIDNLTNDLIDLGLNKNAAIKLFGEEDRSVNKEKGNVSNKYDNMSREDLIDHIDDYYVESRSTEFRNKVLAFMKELSPESFIPSVKEYVISLAKKIDPNSHLESYKGNNRYRWHILKFSSTSKITRRKFYDKLYSLGIFYSPGDPYGEFHLGPSNTSGNAIGSVFISPSYKDGIVIGFTIDARYADGDIDCTDRMEGKYAKLSDTDLIKLAIKVDKLKKEYNYLFESLKESVKDITITTDDSKTTMTSDDEGKVTLTTEPVEEHIDDGEVIEPLTDETEAQIEANDGEEDIDIEDFDEESFDELGEGYFKNVYENVNSFKTSNITTKDNKVIVEGVITFDNNVKKNTSFLFESANKTKSGKYRFIGENLNVTKGNKAFSLIGNVTDKRFLSESMNYNYRTKNDIGKSIRCCGTIKRG